MNNSPEERQSRKRGNDSTTETPRIIISSFGLLNERKISSVDVGLLIKAFIDHTPRTLRCLELVGVSLTNSHLGIIGKALPQFTALTSLALSERRPSNSMVALAAGQPLVTVRGYWEVLRGCEASILCPPRELRLGLRAEQRGYSAFSKIEKAVEHRRRFRFVLATSKSTPRLLRQGAFGEILDLIGDFYAAPRLTYREKTGVWCDANRKNTTAARVRKAVEQNDE